MTSSLFSEEELLLLRQNHAAIREQGTPCLQRFADSDLPVIIFGGGGYGRGIAERIIALGGQIAGFLDNDPQLWAGVRLKDGGNVFPVFDPEKHASILRMYPNIVVLLAVSSADAQEEIIAQCGRLDIRLEFFVPRFKPRNDAVDNPLAERALQLWADERSREIYRLLVRKRSGLDSCQAFSYESNQYFPDFLAAARYRSFLDVGALNGDTFRRFIARFGEDWDNYYAIEPNANSIMRFHPGREAFPRLRLYNMAASDRTEMIRLSDRHSYSRRSEDGKLTVAGDTIDNILGENPVTFVKMDIEGTEPLALRGARRLISSRKPTLAISVYHRFPHLWKIPLYIKRLNPSYRLRLRHHSRYLSETICYASEE